MTATGKTFKWMLWSPSGTHFGASDEFLAEGFRVQLMGQVLELSFEAAGTRSSDLARALAEKYVEALRKRLGMPCSLMTEEDWLERMTPPFGGTRTISTNREDQSRVSRAIREARNELLASADEGLRRCYDHLQDAREHMRKQILGDESVHVAAYKAMEVLEMLFGGEQGAVAVLGNVFKKAKSAANTQRHIPERFKQQLETAERVFELATQVIRSYERHVLEEAHKNKEG